MLHKGSNLEMPLPKISVVTPSLNQARFIEETIQSVINQKYPDIEHIIIDGGSTEGTIEILKKYPHLHWISEPDRGQAHALNKGFRMATGEIIGWLNSDDTYCPNIFHAIAEEFKNNDIFIVCGDGFETDDNSKVLRPLYSRHTQPEDLIRYWKWKYEFVQPAFFFRRSIFDEIGYLDESLYYAMDYDYFIRLGLRYEFKYIRQPFANLRLYGESKTGRNFQKIVPSYIHEIHKVSKRFWGTPTHLKYYGYLFSFFGAIIFSVIKNIFFTPTSKSRAAVKRLFGNMRILSIES